MKNACARAFFCASVLFMSLTIPLQAQRLPEISAGVGTMIFDGSGTDATSIAALRAAVPLVGSWLLGDASFSLASPNETFNEMRVRMGLSEAQIQLQLPLDRARPYIGAGAGWIHSFKNAAAKSTTFPTRSVAAGMRLDFARHFGARVEARLRQWKGQRPGTGSTSGGSAEWTAGGTYIF
jgi:hypothetical protein